MRKKEFEDRLLALVHGDPFFPFVVNLRDGRQIPIKRPPVVYSDGYASFIDLDEQALVEFSYKETKPFAFMTQESPA